MMPIPERPNERRVLRWDDERLPKLWQPQSGLAKDWSIGCAVFLAVLVVICAGFLTMFGGSVSSEELIIVTVIVTVLGGVFGADRGWAEVAYQNAEQEALKRELSDQELHDLLSLIKRVFKDEGWLLIEPVRIRRGNEVWIILTNTEGKGCNGRLVVRKHTLEIVEKACSPR